MSGSLQGIVLWITGQPATGKTTLALGLLDELHQRGVITLWLDSDDLRSVLTPKATYSSEDRDHFYASINHIAQRATEGGVTVVISATASKESYRQTLREVVPHFVEIWLTASPEAVRERDFKGLYRRADAGELPTFPGLEGNYDAPSNPTLSLNTTDHTPTELVTHVMAWLDATFATKT